MAARTKRSASSTTLRSAILSLLTALIAHGALAANPDSSSGDTDVVVTAVSGNVSATLAGVPIDLQVDSKVSLPARIVTGIDGTVSLTQAKTSITVAADTDIEIPAEAAEGQLIARLVQHRGNVFYDVAHRDVGRLRVETPFLVAVIKGTQFNVAVLTDTTTISLFEGRLEILNPDIDEAIQLDAGEIAVRSRAEASIRVVGMDDNRVPPPALAPRAAADAPADGAVARSSGAETEVAVRTETAAATTPAADARKESAEPSLDGILDAKEPAGATGRVDASTAAAIAVATLDTRIDVELGVDTRPDPRGVAVGLDLDARPDHPGVAVGLDLDARPDHPGAAVGRATVDLDRSGIDVTLDTGGGDLRLDTNVDLGSGSLDVAANPGLHLGSLDTANPGLHLGASPVDAVLDTSLDASAGAGAIDVVLDTGPGVDLGLGIDLDARPDHGNGSGNGSENGNENGNGNSGTSGSGPPTPPALPLPTGRGQHGRLL
jgi:FecR-like protein